MYFRGFFQKRLTFIELLEFFSKFSEKPIKMLFHGIHFRGFDQTKIFTGTYFQGNLFSRFFGKN